MMPVRLQFLLAFNSFLEICGMRSQTRLSIVVWRTIQADGLPIRAYYATHTSRGQPCSEGQTTWGATTLLPATMQMYGRKMAVTSSPREGITTKTSRMHFGVWSKNT